MSTLKSASIATALIGAAGGALALYLLDPDAGQARRDRLSGVAGGALDKARQHVDTIAALAREHAARAQDAASGAVQDAARPLHDAARAHFAEAAGVASDARNLVSRVIDETQSALDELRSRGRNAASALRGDEPSSHAVPIALSAAGFCAAGVGLMWLLDPDRGRTRRARLTQRARHVMKRTSRTFHSTGRHLRNKLTGYTAVTRRNLKERLAPQETATE